jgi:hypothetical protein
LWVHRDLRVEGGQLQVLLMVLGAEVAPRQDKDHRVVAVQLAESAPLAGVVGQFVVREPAPGNDVGSHGTVSLVVSRHGPTGAAGAL